MSEIIDLYSKFLLAFVGIVTPALAIYLNNYLIDRTRFEALLKRQEEQSAALINQQFIEANQNGTVGINFYNESNKRLGLQKKKIQEWESITNRLNPRNFFKQNILLLAVSLFFLFCWLLVRSDKIIYSNTHHYLYQIIPCAISVGSFSYHIYNLIDLGFYLIRVRPVVDEINDHIKNRRTIKKSSPGEGEDVLSETAKKLL